MTCGLAACQVDYAVAYHSLYCVRMLHAKMSKLK